MNICFTVGNITISVSATDTVVSDSGKKVFAADTADITGGFADTEFFAAIGGTRSTAAAAWRKAIKVQATLDALQNMQGVQTKITTRRKRK